MEKSKRHINKLFWSYIIVFMWPLIYYFRYVIAGESFSLTIGNDFPVLYNYKMILLDKLSNFSFPLWSPSEANGYAFFSNPHAQVFYPFNILLTSLYKMNGGFSYADFQKFTILGLSVFSVGLLLWLRSLKTGLLFAVLAVCIISVSSKMTEILRFPNAVHTIAWVPFILYGCTIALDRSRQFKAGIIIFVSFVLMVTAGYAYYIYYSVFLIVPYLLLLVFLKSRKFCFSEYESNFKKYFLTLCISTGAAFAVCYPYLSSVKNLLDQTNSRTGGSIEFSTLHKFGFTDTIGSLFYPPAAHIEGWYYFGMAGFLIVACLFIFMLSDFSVYKKQIIIFSIIFLWFLIISYATYGESSVLFRFLWEYFPSFSRLRILGRMNIIFIPVIAYLLAVAYQTIFNFAVGPKQGKAFRYFIIAFFIFYAGVLIIQLYFYNNKIFPTNTINYSKNYYGELDEKIFIVLSVISFLILALILIASRFIPAKKLLAASLIILAAVNVIDMNFAGLKQWSVSKSPDTSRKIINTDNVDLVSLSTPRSSKDGFVTLTPVFSVGYIPEWNYDRYINFVKKYEEDLANDTTGQLQESFAKLMGLNDGKRIFCSDKINYENISDFISDCNQYENSELVKIDIQKYNGDELVCIIDTKENGYCTFVDNWEEDWKTTVNGIELKVEKLFGTFKSVKIQKGKNTVVFKYEPKIFYW